MAVVVALFAGLGLAAWQSVRTPGSESPVEPPLRVEGQARSSAPSEPPQPVAIQEPADVVSAPLPGEATPFPEPPRGACPLVEGPEGVEPTRWPVSSDWHVGADGYREAQREQERSKAPMVVYFFTDWCGYCRQFERDLLSRYEVEGYFRARLVKLRINPEAGREEKTVADAFGVDGYPSFFLLTSSAIEPRKFSVWRHRASDGEAYATKAPEQFIKDLEGEVRRAVQKLVRDGYTQREAGRLDEALAALNDAIALDPEYVEAYLQRGMTHLEKESRESAYADLRRALSGKPDDDAVFRAVGRDLWKRGEWDAGVACWTVFLERRGEDGQAYRWRADMHERRGDLARAREDAVRSCRLGERGGCEAVARIRQGSHAGAGPPT